MLKAFRFMAIIFTYLAHICARLFVANATTLFRKQNPGNEIGGPGEWPVPDLFNTLDVDWNRTYGLTEPQQIHITLGSESKFATVQFATLGQVEGAILQYWPKRARNRELITIDGSEDWTFIDGGNAKRPLYLHNIKTNYLRSSTIYQYQVGSKPGNGSPLVWSPTFEFHTASRDDSFSFLSMGDVGINNAVSIPHLMKLGSTHQYDFVTVSGDQAYDMNDFDGQKGDQYMNFLQELYANVPYVGAPGNHESAYNFSQYKNRFNNVPFAQSKSENAMQYSFDYKALHFVSFSTEVYFEGSDVEIQSALNWLDNDLESANQNRDQRPWIIVNTHRPIYCSTFNDDCSVHAERIRTGVTSGPDNTTRWGGLEPLLQKHKVNMYLSGHVHNYERTYPVFDGKLMSRSYHDAPSVFQVVVGNGGQPEGFKPFNDSLPAPDWSAVRYGGYGFSTIRVSPESLELTHHQVHADGSIGGIIDQFSVTRATQKESDSSK